MFNSRTRKSNETVSTFVNELRCIAAKCEYGLQLKENLRDRLVAGVNNETFQQRLLQNPGQTFESALTTCLAMETAAKNVHDLSQVAQKQAPFTSYKVTTTTMLVIKRKQLFTFVAENTTHMCVG